MEYCWNSPLDVVWPPYDLYGFSGEEIPISWNANPYLCGTAVRFELWNGKMHEAGLGTDWSPDADHFTIFPMPLVPEGANYQVLGISLYNPAIQDINDGPFRIVGGPIRLDWPRGNVIWQADSPQVVHWRANPFYCGTAVRLELWAGNRFMADLGEAWDPEGEGVMLLDLSAIPSWKNYKLRLVSDWDPGYAAWSEGFLEIRNRTLEPLNAVDARTWGLYQ